jgi:HAE1 family hydrophobic/amphiphilic exporter-1
MLIIVVLGGICLMQLKQELMPKLTFPNLMVVADYSGVAPAEIEKTLTRPLESSVRSVPGIKRVKASSYEGLCIINAEFNWGVNLDDASNQIRDKIERIKKYLPEGASTPMIFKQDTGSIPVAFIGVTGDRDIGQLQKLIDDVIVPKFERLDGVSQVIALGGRTREIQINADKTKLISYGISINQIVYKIAAENISVSAGNVKESGEKQYLVRGVGEFKNIEQIENLIVGVKGGVPIYLKNIAEVKDTLSEETSLGRVNGKTAISIMIQKQTDANTVDVAKKIRNLIPKIKAEIPGDVNFIYALDTSEMVTESINSLVISARDGAALAGLLILLFLAEFWPTVIILIAIPVSLFVAFIAMYINGSTFNFMSMGGLVIALGRLVDDSVVVMENIYRHRQMGKDSVTAAIDGTKEVGIAVLSSTIVTVVVLLPLVFAKGIVVQLFKDFGLTVFFSLLGSLVVAFTIVPMLASKLFKKDLKEKEEKYEKMTHPKNIVEKTDKYFYNAGRKLSAFQEGMKNVYAKMLKSSLRNKKWIMSIAGLCLVLTVILFGIVPKEYMSGFVSGRYQVYYILPKGSSFDATKKMELRLEQALRERVPDLDVISANGGISKASAMMAAMSGGAGLHRGQMYINLKKGKKRVTTDVKLYNIIDEIQKENQGAQIRLASAGSQMFGSGKPVEIKVFGTDIMLLKKVGDDLSEKLKTIKGLKSVSSSLEEGLPEFTIKYNNEKLARYGMSVSQINAEMKTAVDGIVPSYFREAGEEVEIRIRLKEKDRKSIKDILDLPVISPAGFSFPLKDVVDYSYTESPAQIDREDAKRIVTVGGDITDRKLSDIVADVEKVLKDLKLPEGYFYEFGGQEQDRRDSFSVLFLALIVAVLLIYMILASLYESLIHPFTILISVPFAFIGSMVALYITNTALGVTVFIGFIMLVGIVATNAIVLIDFIIKRTAEEKDRKKAIVDAAATRLRPILITALATLFALLPLALGIQEGMEMQIPLGIAVVGGLFSSTLLTLFVIPVVFDIIENIKEWFNKRGARGV